MSEPQTADAPREVTLDEGMAMAVLFQRNGQLKDAESVYRKILEVAPDHAGALHYYGVLAHQQGRSDEALRLIESSLAIVPDFADGHSNLGIIFKALGRLDEAVVAYRRAIELDPRHANAYSNLGVVLRAQRKFAEAEEAYRAAIRIDPNHIDAYHNLGVLLAGLRRTAEAVICFCKVTTLSPSHPEARRLLALAHCALGEPEKAVKIYEDWLAEEPDNAVARHMLAAVSGREVPARASEAFVEKVFDDFAASFDAKLKQLSYRAPEIVAALVADSHLAAATGLDVLDAGCGTGLCGPLIGGYARRLVGVDLSGRMLDQARERGMYHELVQGELTAYLREHEQAFDLIVSADTLVYFGPLADVAAAAAAALRPGGVFVFTVEEAPSGDEPLGYGIQHHGRYVHSQAYVGEVLRSAGLEGVVFRAELRMESGVPVAGLAVRATKPASGTPHEGAHHA
jgi:predicted TPR repeat methyltransferase